ncbi:MAG: hypothetical protein AAF573_09440 [Bacteroidota bacterium]
MKFYVPILLDVTQSKVKKLLFLFALITVVIFCSCKKDNNVVTSDNETPIIEEPIIENPCPLGQYNGLVVSYQNTREEIDALNATVIHSWLQWDFAEPNLNEPFILKEEVTEEMIAKYASGELEGIDWTITDNHIAEFDGLQLIMGVGSGWKNSVPLLDGEKITPDIIGRDQYIGQLYLHTRACVRRYKDKVLAWQIENEPNISEELILLGLREGDAWTDMDFMTEVLNTLEEAVRIEDPDAWITINFYVDVVEDYEADIARWLPLVDMVGIDTYQDFFSTNPKVAADSVLSKVNYISTLTNDKPVMIMETGYTAGPEELGYSEENQKIFVQEIYSRINEYNGCGITYFKHTTTEETGTAIFPFRNFRGLVNEEGEGKLSWHFLREFFSGN